MGQNIQNGMNHQNHTNMYDTNINNSRIFGQSTMNLGENPYINQQTNPMNQLSQQGGFNNADFIKGVLLGAAATFLLTNKDAQETLMKVASKGTELFQASMEELKERYEDVKAQMEANKEL